jgi:hypothetical protein
VIAAAKRVGITSPMQAKASLAIPRKTKDGTSTEW